MSNDARPPADRLVGRQHEQAVLAHLAASLQDGARVLVLVGPAGAGKTALWRYGVAAAGSAARVLTCRPSELATRASYSGLADLLDELGAEVDMLPGNEKHALMTAVRREHFDRVGTDTVALAASRVLDTAAGRPLVLAIDDLQWLDASSARVIGFALRRLADRPIGLLATQRDALNAQTLRAALPDGRISLLDVGALSEDETGELIRLRMGAALLRPLVRQIHRTAGGNPLFSLELARVVLQQTKPLPAGVPLPLPNTLGELMGRRVAAVSATTRDVLLVVAAAANATVETVEQALGQGALAGVQRALDAGLLESDSGRLRFTHPLLAAASYSNADAARRRRVHVRLASISMDVEERARQLSAATDLPDPRVAELLDAGAAAAYARGAPDEAAALAERALHLTSLADRGAVLRRTVAAADILREIGDTEKCRTVLKPLVEQLAPGTDRAAVIRRLATVATHQESFMAGRALLDVAIGEVGEDAAVRAALYRDRAGYIMQAADVRDSSADAALAVHFAQRSGDMDALASAESTYLMQAVIRADAPADLGARLSHLAALPESRDRWFPTASRSVMIAAMLKWIDHFDGARDLLSARFEDFWNRQRDGLLMPVLFQLGELECWAGRLDEARRLATLGLDTVRRSRNEALRPMWLHPAALAAARSGDIGTAGSLASDSLEIAECLGESRHQMRAHAVLGFLALSCGDNESAVRHLGQVETLQHALGYEHPGVIRADADHIEALIARGDLAAATRRFVAFRRQATRSRSTWAKATGLRCSGLLHAASGEVEAAEADLREAVAESERVPDPLEYGRTLLALGGLLRRIRHRSDAQATLCRAGDTFRAIGANLWALKADSEYDRAKGHGSSASAQLTPTETRVAKLIATGKSNKEIAAEIYLSPKTIEAHLSSIYRKLGLRSRTELAAHLLGEHGTEHVGKSRITTAQHARSVTATVEERGEAHDH